MIQTNRRDFFGLLGLGAAALPLALDQAAQAAPAQEWDVLYDHWTEDVETVLDENDIVAHLLGPEVASKLHVVRNNNDLYGLVYDRNGTEARTKSTARRHTNILGKAGTATAILDAGYHDLFNVSYGKGQNLEQLKIDFAEVRRILGNDLGKELVIEEGSHDYELVYNRRGDEQSTITAAARHTQLLERGGSKLKASTIRQRNSDTVYGDSSRLDDEEERKPARPRTQPEESGKKKIATSLEQDIQDLIDGYRHTGRIARDEMTAWSVYCFSSGKKIVSINEDKAMQCASMVKPFVALAYLHGHRGKRDPKITRALERMIQKSDNNATNRIIQQVGGAKKVQQTLQRNYGEIFRNTAIVESIPAGGCTYKNAASAHDYSRFLHALWNNDLPESREIRRLMALPGRDRVYSGAAKIPVGTIVWNKTGSTSHLCGDMAILSAQGRDGTRHAYTVIGIIQKQARADHYASWIASRGNVIRQVSNLVYEHMKQEHNLI